MLSSFSPTCFECQTGPPWNGHRDVLTLKVMRTLFNPQKVYSRSTLSTLRAFHPPALGASKKRGKSSVFTVSLVKNDHYVNSGCIVNVAVYAVIAPTMTFHSSLQLPYSLRGLTIFFAGFLHSGIPTKNRSPWRVIVKGYSHHRVSWLACPNRLTLS